jgi:hypothetical protein
MISLQNLLEDRRRLALIAVAVVIVVALASKLLNRERLYFIHVEGDLRPPLRWKVKDDFYSSMHVNLGLSGVRWMVRHDGSVWQRRDNKWVQLKERSAKSHWKAGPDGKYALDVEIQLPSAPKACNLRMHKRGCSPLQVNADLRPGESSSRLVGNAGSARLLSRISREWLAKHAKDRRPQVSQPGATATPVVVEEGEGGEAEVPDDAPVEEPVVEATP